MDDRSYLTSRTDVAAMICLLYGRESFVDASIPDEPHNPDKPEVTFRFVLPDDARLRIKAFYRERRLLWDVAERLKDEYFANLARNRRP